MASHSIISGSSGNRIAGGKTTKQGNQREPTSCRLQSDPTDNRYQILQGYSTQENYNPEVGDRQAEGPGRVDVAVINGHFPVASYCKPLYYSRSSLTEHQDTTSSRHPAMRTPLAACPLCRRRRNSRRRYGDSAPQGRLRGLRIPFGLSRMNHQLHLPKSHDLPDVQIATVRSDLVDAFELVYRQYLDKGYISPNKGRIVYEPVFGTPVSRTLVSTTGDGEIHGTEIHGTEIHGTEIHGTEIHGTEILGTMTVVGDNPNGLRVEATYPHEVNALREAGRSIAEVTCLAVRSNSPVPSRAVFFALTRFTIRYALWRRYDDLLLAIHPRHEPFYRRCFQADLLGPCRPYDFANRNPAVCCRLDLNHLLDRLSHQVIDRYNAAEITEVKCVQPPIRLEDHLYFCRRRGLHPHGHYRVPTRISPDAA